MWLLTAAGTVLVATMLFLLAVDDSPICTYHAYRKHDVVRLIGSPQSAPVGTVIAAYCADTMYEVRLHGDWSVHRVRESELELVSR